MAVRQYGKIPTNKKERGVVGAIKVETGSAVKVKGTGRTGRVLSLTAQKVAGRRGRPPTVVSVLHEDGVEAVYGVRELVTV